MKKHLLSLSFLMLLGILQSNAQSVVFGIGQTIGLDYTRSPYYHTKDFDPTTTYNSSDPEVKQIHSVSVYTISFNVNTTLVKLNANKSISLNVAPAIRATINNSGIGAVSVPLTVNYNKGVLSTFDSDAEKGITFGLGAVLQTTPLFAGSSYESVGAKMYAQPCAQFGYRYWGRDSKVGEVLLQVGYMSHKAVTTYDYDYNNYNSYVETGTQKSSSFSAKITFIKYLNY